MLDINKVIHTLSGLLYPTSCIGCGSFDVEICTPCKNLFLSVHKDSLEGTKGVYWQADFKKPEVKKIIKALKFQNRRNLAKLITKNIPKTDIVVPIPLHSSKLMKRGYNQSELLANHIGTATLALVRIKDTEPQGHTQSREARFKNMEGAFVVTNPEIIKNKTILLVDDVYTTGATLSKAAQELKKAGAHEVICLALAHG